MKDVRIDTLLVDLDGTVYQHGELVPGAAEALAAIERRGIAVKFVTNTTSKPASAVLAALASMGLEIEPSRLVTAPIAARRYLRSEGLARCHFLVAPALMDDFEGIEAVDERPDAVVLGDAGDGLDYASLSRAFRFLLDGARLVTMARNRYYLGPDGLTLDVGPFVVALEYAAGVEAVCVGKPDPGFFHAALDGAAPEAAAMVGDDLEGDVGGAQAAGMRGILVRTGKFRAGELERSLVRPDAVIDSVALIPELLA